MKRLMIWTTVMACAPVAWAQTATRWDVLPYAGAFDYSDTLTKQDSSVVGAYTYFGYGANHSVEADVSLTRICYDGAAMSRIDQTDVVLAYSNYQVLDTKFRVGVHAIVSDDDATQGAVLFGGIHHYQPDQYSLGIDAYYSNYPDYVPDLDVYQATGTFGIYLADPLKQGRWYSETRGHAIRLSKDIGYSEETFFSGGQALSYFYRNWTLQVFAWVGKQVFSVQKDGFVVYNLAEKHQGALGGSIKWAFSKKSALKLELTQSRFKELGNPDTAHSTKVMVLLGHTF